MDVPTQKQAAPTNPESSGPHKSTNNQMQIAHALSSPTVCFITVAQKKYIIPSLVTRLMYNCAHLRSTKESLTLEGSTGWYLVVLGQYKLVLLV